MKKDSALGAETLRLKKDMMLVWQTSLEKQAYVAAMVCMKK
jgi:hypothetical protein